METPEFLKKIDWTDLRTQKSALIEVMNTVTTVEQAQQLEGILALIDAVQEHAVEHMDMSAIHVYDFELEEDRENPDPDKTKTVFLCSNCGSDNVEMKAWVNPNTDGIGDTISSEEEDCYCNDCDGNHELLSHELKASAKVVGFQIVGVDGTDNEGEMHPAMDASFCLYNLSWCRQYLHEYYNWRLLTIWEGDVEEPTMMFEGDPRD